MSRSMAQSNGRCGGRPLAFVLLKTSMSVWYSLGICTYSVVSGLSTVVEARQGVNVEGSVLDSVVTIAGFPT